MKYHIIPVTSFKQNCSLIWCEVTHEAILIDPGGESKKLLKEVNKLNLTLNKILLTHGHIDHIGSAMELKKYYNIPIVGPNKDDKILLDNISLQCKMFGLDLPTELVVTPDVWLTDGDVVRVGYERFDVLHCPGHSPGHVVFWNKSKRFILMGDVLFKDNIGRTDLPGGDLRVLIKSIKTKLFPLGDDNNFIPGHGDMSTIGDERARMSLYFNKNIIDTNNDLVVLDKDNLKVNKSFC